jgi:hypothetical protein
LLFGLPIRGRSPAAGHPPEERIEDPNGDVLREVDQRRSSGVGESLYPRLAAFLDEAGARPDGSS